MKLLLMLLLATGDDPRRGLELLAAGRPAEAAEAFAAALRDRPDDPELHYNHALALWRAGRPADAEAAAEKAAALSDGRLAGLRDGILGNLRFAQSVAAEQEQGADPGRALELAEQALAHYQRGALRPDATPELERNFERALQRVEELRRKRDEQQKQQQQPEPQDPQQQEQKQQDRKQQQEQKQQQNEQQDPKPPDPPKPDQPKPDAAPPQQDPQPPSGQDPKPEQQQQPGEQPQPEPRQDQQGKDAGERPEGAPPPAPGEGQPGAELSPEQRQRLLDALRQLEARHAELREARKTRRPIVERDW